MTKTHIALATTLFLISTAGCKVKKVTLYHSNVDLNYVQLEDGDTIAFPIQSPPVGDHKYTVYFPDGSPCDSAPKPNTPLSGTYEKPPSCEIAKSHSPYDRVFRYDFKAYPPPPDGTRGIVPCPHCPITIGVHSGSGSSTQILKGGRTSALDSASVGIKIYACATPQVAPQLVEPTTDAGDQSVVGWTRYGNDPMWEVDIQSGVCQDPNGNWTTKLTTGQTCQVVASASDQMVPYIAKTSGCVDATGTLHVPAKTTAP